MNTKHTPGPWVAQRDWESVYSPDPEELEEYMKRPITVIKSLAVDKNVASCHDLFEFNPADAQLIAAAPDLLEALRGLLNAPDPDEVEDATPRFRAVMNAHAAIAKAIGGAR